MKWRCLSLIVLCLSCQAAPEPGSSRSDADPDVPRVSKRRVTDSSRTSSLREGETPKVEASHRVVYLKRGKSSAVDDELVEIFGASTKDVMMIVDMPLGLALTRGGTRNSYGGSQQAIDRALESRDQPLPTSTASPEPDTEQPQALSYAEQHRRLVSLLRRAVVKPHVVYVWDTADEAFAAPDETAQAFLKSCPEHALEHFDFYAPTVFDALRSHLSDEDFDMFRSFIDPH